MNQLFRLVAAILILTGNVAFAQCPENIGFDSGTFKNWTSYVGRVDSGAKVTVDEVSGAVWSRQTIMSASDGALDPYGHFPTVSPNGSKYAVRLGNDSYGQEAERLSYTFTVPVVQQYSLVLNYAVVLQNFGHSSLEQPRFRVTVFNVTDNALVDCPAFDFAASGDLPGFKTSDIEPNTPRAPAAVVYKDWAATTINLSAYVGKQIRLEFTTNDCVGIYHFGYAYFDINEDCKELITGSTYCPGQNSITLQGPRGFAEYKWYREGNLTDAIGDKQSLTINPAPPDGTKYILRVKPYEDLGCPDFITTTIKRSAAPFIFNVIERKYFCRGTTVNLKAADITQGSMTGLRPFEYYSDPVTQEYLRDPDKISQPGIYYIKGTNAEGCSNILPVELVFYDEVTMDAANPAPVTYPAKIDLSATHTTNPTYKYFYYTNSKLTTPVTDYKNISFSGKFYIKAQSANGCEKILAVNVTINPPPPNIISGPTVFTPNNDGINDLFNITIDGFVDFGTLKIFNRSGQFLFQTKNQNNGWDGNFNGRPLPTGTYYWLFEGTDQYYHTRISKGGYVSIIK